MSETTPLGWKRTTFKSICRSLVNGGTPDTGNGKYWGGNTPWVTGADFTSSGIGEIRRYVSEAGVRSSSTNVVRAGNLLLVTRTGVGKLAIAPSDIAISQDITGIYLDENEADSGFVYFLMRQGVEDLKKRNQGTSINGIIRSDLEGYVVQIPCSLTEQKRIASILATLESAIEKTESLIAKYQQIKAGLMHDLFTCGVTADGKLRPPREQAPELYKETPIGWIPKEWDCRKLGKILDESGGYLQTGPFGSQLHAHEYTDDGIPVVMPQNIEDGKIFTHTIARIPESRAQFLARHRVKLSDIIIARRGELSRAATISQEQIGWVCGTGCFLLRLSGSKLDPRFFSYAYRHDIVQRQIEGLAVGSTMPSLNNSVMSSLYFPYLTEDEQHRISDRLETQDNALLSLRYENEKLEKQKAGLMHNLLTGYVRVPAVKAKEVSTMYHTSSDLEPNT